MRQAACFFILGLILLPMMVFAATVSPDQVLSTQILSGSRQSTVVSAVIDPAALRARMTSMEFGDRVSDGLGTILAIAGHGIPAAVVQNYELGDPLESTMTLTDQDVASSSEQLVILGQPSILHDLRIVPVNFRPFMRDASGVVRAVSRIQTEVTTTGFGGANEKDDPPSLSSAFAPLYRAAVSNLDDYIDPNISLREPGRYLVIGKDTRIAALNNVIYYRNWLDLKKRKGYQMQIMGLANPSTGNVRVAIQTAYNDPTMRDLEFVMLIGDTDEVKTFVETSPIHSDEQSVGDNFLYCVAGNDSLPDLFGGRVSARSPSGFANYFSKEYGYETNPYTDNMRWYQSITCAAGNYDNSGQTYPVTPVWNVNWTRDRVMRDNVITNADTFYYHDQIDDPNLCTQIRQDIDSGVCAVFYRGWASAQEWQFPIFTNQCLYGINNVRRTPAVFGIVCGSGDFGFSGGPCLGEDFTTGVGTVTNPMGAICYIGASDAHTNTRDNNAVLAGIVEALMHGVRSEGALLVAGKLEGWRQFPLERAGSPLPLAYYFILHVFNLLGDPETQIYFSTPGSFDITNPGQLTPGQNLVPVTVLSGGQPVPDAVVTFRKAGSDDVASAMTDGSGLAYIPANLAPGDTTGQLTVWKAGYFLRRIDIPINTLPFDPKIAAVNWSDGNDNKPNPGETISYTLSVQNDGTNATTLNVSVTSLDTGLTVVSGSGSVPTLNSGQSGTSSQLSVTLASGLYNGQLPRLNVVLQDGSNNVTRQIQVPVAAPELVIDTVRVADGNNGILEPGDGTVPIYLTATNVGGQNGSNLSVIVTSFDNAISFPSTGANWTQLNIGQTAESNTAITAQLSSGVTPGRQILLRFEFHQNGAICGRSSYLLPTGLVTIHSPTGPDAYGYYAYEDIDAGYSATPTYNWVELDPANGGGGADAHTVTDDSHFAMGLPVPFTYYGQSFDSVWICSNGWFSFERAHIPEFRNWELPSPIGAPSLVAPFWTDLCGKRVGPAADTVFTVWTRYDQNPNRFIVEWRCFLRAGLDGPSINTASCVFEAILEYPPSGDGSVLFQYNQVTTNLNRTGGNYFTVGWEDSYHERGLTLTYASMYPASVDSLRSGRAIRVTTQAPDNFNGVGPLTHVLPKQFALHEAFPNPFNPTTDLRFDLPKDGRATLRVYDVLGREVATLLDEHRAAGTYTVSFDASRFPSGLYFARLTSGANTQVRKLMLIK